MAFRSGYGINRCLILENIYLLLELSLTFSIVNHKLKLLIRILDERRVCQGYFAYAWNDKFF